MTGTRNTNDGAGRRGTAAVLLALLLLVVQAGGALAATGEADPVDGYPIPSDGAGSHRPGYSEEQPYGGLPGTFGEQVRDTLGVNPWLAERAMDNAKYVAGECVNCPGTSGWTPNLVETTIEVMREWVESRPQALAGYEREGGHVLHYGLRNGALESITEANGGYQPPPTEGDAAEADDLGEEKPVDSGTEESVEETGENGSAEVHVADGDEADEGRRSLDSDGVGASDPLTASEDNGDDASPDSDATDGEEATSSASTSSSGESAADDSDSDGTPDARDPEATADAGDGATSATSTDAEASEGQTGGHVAAAVIPSSVEIVEEPEHGVAEVDPVAGTISYEREGDYVGPDHFTYAACDADGACWETTVTTSDYPELADTDDVLRPDVETGGEVGPALVTSGSSAGTSGEFVFWAIQFLALAVFASLYLWQRRPVGVEPVRRALPTSAPPAT